MLPLLSCGALWQNAHRKFCSAEILFQAGLFMRYRIFALATLVGALTTGSSRGDGLIFQLPADGTWARYDTTGETQATSKELPKQDFAMTGSLTISSVGEVTRSHQKCRWIELKAETKSKGAYPKLVLKMLVAEDRLKRGEDPLSHSILTFFDPKPGDANGPIKSYINEGFNRIQYEIDRFRWDFPEPLDNVKSLMRETIETPAGKFEDCEVFTGTSAYDGPLLGGARTVTNATYRIAIHPNAPFGVVSMQIEVEGSEIHDDFVASLKGKKTLRLAATGKDAVSDLPKAASKSD
jgi:hypothetical protein